MFEDRAEAGRLLAARLRGLRGRDPLILAIPRGAVPMGKVIADALEGELDVALVRKLGAPGNPELAIGSISETGERYLDERTLGWLAVDPGYVERETARQLETLRRRRSEYTPIRPPIDPQGRVVVVVDDGIATGATMIAALRAARAAGAAKVIAAVGVAPPDTLARLRGLANEVVAIETPHDFMAVGQFFADFGQVSDEEVVAILREQSERAGRRAA